MTKEDRNSVVVKINDSWNSDNYYYVEVGFLNLAEHGVYLEVIWIDDPKNTPLDIFIPPPPKEIKFGSGEDAESAGTWASPDRLLPRLLAAGIDMPTQFKLRLTDDKPSSKTDTALSQRNTFKLGYRVSQLNKPTSEDKFQLVRLRRNGSSSEHKLK